MNGFDKAGSPATRCGKSFAPVRRASHLAGQKESVFWHATTRQQTRLIVLAARRYELTRRLKGQRNGPLGSIALEVLELMANLVNHKSGRLEPSLTTLMRFLKRSRDAIVRALRNLRDHGFLDWIRRYVPRGSSGQGPQIVQVANAYRLNLPSHAKAGVRSSPPLPDDWSSEIETRHATRKAWQANLSPEELPFLLLGSTPLAESLARLAKRFTQRESANRSESLPELNPSEGAWNGGGDRSGITG